MSKLVIVFILISLYFLSVLSFVVFARYKETKSLVPSLSEFFLAGKNLKPIVLAATFAASYFSTWTVLGIPGMVYAQGIGALLFILLLDFIGLFFIFFLGPKLMQFAKENKVYSPVEIISQSYNSRLLGLLIALIFSIFLIPYISLQLVGVGAFISSYSGGEIDYTTGVGSMLFIIFIYLFLGGMRAVAYTDIIQLVAIVIGSVFGFYYLISNYELSLGNLLLENLKSDHDIVSLPGPLNMWSFSNILIVGLVSLGIHCQPHILTRYMMTVDKKNFNLLAVMLIVSRFVMSFLAIGFALFAISKFGINLKPNDLMGIIFKSMADSGFIGLILSSLMLMGALGAAMSTADSLLISIGQIATRDILRPYFKLKPKTQILLSKLVMFLTLVLAFFAGIKPPKFMVDLGIYSAAGCAILIPTFIHFKWAKKSLLASFLSISTGLSLLIIFAVIKIIYNYEVLGVNIGILPFILSFMVFYIVSLVSFNLKKLP